MKKRTVFALSRRVFVCASILAVVMLSAPAALLAQEPIISTEVSARGKREHRIKVEEWGRYAVEVKSGEGVSVSVVDKLRGVIAKCEAEGGKEGRLDVFLEAGEYKIFTEGPNDAQGNVRLSVTKFTSAANADKYEYLPPFEQVTGSLADKEARGWWFFVPRDTLVYVEAMGRRLGCLAVFRGGQRIVAMSSSADFVNGSVPGKPLAGRRVVMRLERGKYLVMVYGGDSDNYTVSDGASPLYVNWMLPAIEPGRAFTGKVGAGGVNRYIVYPSLDPSAGIKHVVVEVSGTQWLAVEQHWVSVGKGMERIYFETLNRRPQSGGQLAVLNIRDYGNRSAQVFSVSGAPGTEFKISPANRNNEYVYSYSVKEDGAYRIAASHVVAAGENAGVSGVLVDMKDSSIIALKADTLSPARPMRWAFNLLGGQRGFIWVDEAGTYTVSSSGGVGYRWRVKRFYVVEPRNYSPPNWAQGRGDVSLAKGLYEVEITMWQEKGSAVFTMFRGAGAEDRAGRQKLAQSLALGPFDLKKGRGYRFYLNKSSISELASVIMDRYPPPPKENVAEIYLTGAAADRADSSAAKTSELKMGTPHYVTLGRKGEAAYGFRINEAGVYKIETTGRLQTKLTLRDRFGAVSQSQTANGVGRNARVADFFLPGDYIVLAETVGESAGRMGVVLSRGELRKDGALLDGVDKRAAVNANGAVVYDFAAGKRALYRFESFGASGGAAMRLEDSDGWPLFNHGAPAPQEVALEKGAYKVYSLPVDYDNYRVTRVDAVKSPLKISGPGPHGIAINEPVSAVWVESGAPARFLFEVSAPMDAKVSLSPDFKGKLKRQGKDTASINVSGGYAGVLQKGKYEIAVTPVKPQNYSPYELSVTTADLVAGIGYEVESDRTLRVQVGERGEYEIFSQGRSEVSARLYAGDKKTEVARGGGDRLDWNFFISERLDSGSYYLRLSGFDPGAELPAKVFMRRAEDTTVQQVRLDSSAAARLKVRLSGKQAVIPIAVQSGDVLAVSANGVSQLVCELEAAGQGGSGPVSIGRRRGKRVNMSAVIENGAAYTLRVWSDDRVEDVAAVEIRAAAALPISFEAAQNGVVGQASKEAGNTVFYRIDNITAGPGHYELIATENEFSRTAGTIGGKGLFEEGEGMIIASAGKRLFVEAAFVSPDKYRFVMLPVMVPDIRELRDRNVGKFETSDKYRLSKNQIKLREREELPVVIKRGGDKVFAVDTPVNKLCLVTLAMPAGQPIVGLSAPAPVADFVRNGMPVAGGQYIGKGVSITAVIPGDTGRLAGWNALAGGSLAAGVNAAFSMRGCKMEKTDTLKTGRTAWAAKPLSAKEYRVAGSGGALAAIKLSPRTGVLYVSPAGARDMYYGGDDGAQYAIEPAGGGRMFLFGKAEEDDVEGDGSIEIELYASQSESKAGGVQGGALAAGAESVKFLPIDTREALRVKTGTKQTVRLFKSGSVESVDWVSRSGAMTQNVKDGGKLTNQNGVLLVNYKAGVGKLRLCKDDGGLSAQNECKWGEPAARREGVPAIKENSRLTMTHGVNQYSIELSEPAHVSVIAAAPAAAVLYADEKILDYREFWENMQWEMALPAGKHAVGIKPLTGGSLSGVPLTVSFYPILRLTEEKPLQMQIMAPQHRYAKFELKKKGKVGIGLSTQGQAVTAALFDANGKKIAEGSQIFRELDKGAYHVSLSMPAGSTQGGANVTVRLFGQENPPTEPPGELINWIIKDGRGERPVALP
jgi:hypothetical protein